jgi:hypothetical protein
MAGKVFEKEALFVSILVGNAKDAASGIEYRLMTSLSGSPMITSEKTGKTWGITWPDLIKLAIEAGIESEAR